MNVSSNKGGTKRPEMVSDRSVHMLYSMANDIFKENLSCLTSQYI
jgi:hypothetical protein